MSNSAIPPWMGDFSRREIEILKLISDGLSNREIARRLYLSLNTVKWYNKHLYAKLGVNSRTQALNLARQYNLLQSQAGAQGEEKPHPINNLPAQLTSYVGRIREITEIQELLADSRLVVLTGAGGTGKTRLALQVAEGLSTRYRHGVWLVELAPLSDPALVADAIAQVLKVKTSGDTSLVEAIKRSLARKHLLLLLDNFEHLLEAAPLVTDLLASAPQLTVLVTSRERLHLYGEVEYPVRPLSLPDLRQQETARELLAYEAVDLFIQRARAAQPGLEIHDANISAAARICLRLDGLPLAIELAASQVKIYPPSTLAQRLEHSLGALPDGPRDLPARQRTLRATIEWSVNLLQENQKRLLARLSVFSGGGVLEGIQSICAPGLAGDFLDSLVSLVDKNLVFVREGPGGEPRFTMLETICEFAHELLVAGGEAETIHKRHAAYYAELGEQFSREIRGPRHVYWNARLQAEQGNLNAALAWSLAGTEPPFGLRLVAALMDHWYYNGTLEDARWAELALEKMESAPPDLRAAVLKSVGTLYHNLGDMPRVGKLFRQALDLFQQLGDERNAAWSMMFLSIAGSENPHEIENCLAMAQQSLAALRRWGDKPGMARALSALGELWRMKGDYESARSCYAESLAISQETGERIRQAIQYSNLGFIAYHQSQHQLAVKYIQQSLAILEELDIPGARAELYSLAGPTAALGYPLQAARLIGAADAQQEVTGIDLQPPDRQDVLPVIDSVRQALGEEAYQQAWQAGYAMSTRQAIALALSRGEDETYR
jgi:predicted ATPase/DNA-binding CsgD family transcriptional regulator